MSNHIVKEFGSVTVHIPILTEAQKQKRKEKLSRVAFDLWCSMSDHQQQQILNYQQLKGGETAK